MKMCHNPACLGSTCICWPFCGNFMVKNHYASQQAQRPTACFEGVHYCHLDFPSASPCQSSAEPVNWCRSDGHLVWLSGTVSTILHGVAGVPLRRCKTGLEDDSRCMRVLLPSLSRPDRSNQCSTADTSTGLLIDGSNTCCGLKCTTAPIFWPQARSCWHGRLSRYCVWAKLDW